MRVTGTRGSGLDVRPAIGLLLGGTLALSTMACQEPAMAEALVYVQNEEAPVPQYLLFSWLYCRDFIRRDDRVPERGQLSRSENPVATVLVELEASEPTRRGVFLRGMVNGIAVSAGHAALDIRPGLRSEVTVRLNAGAVLNGEAIAARFDWCPETYTPPDAAPPGQPVRAN